MLRIWKICYKSFKSCHYNEYSEMIKDKKDLFIKVFFNNADNLFVVLIKHKGAEYGISKFRQKSLYSKAS